MRKRLVSIFCLFGLLLAGCSSSPGISSSSESSSFSSSSSQSTSSSLESSSSEEPVISSYESIPESIEPSSTSEESEISGEPSSEVPSSSEEPTSEPSSEPTSESLPFSSEEFSDPSSESSWSSDETSESTEESSEPSESSSESSETDDRLYVFVQNGQTEGFYNVYFDAKIDMTISFLYVESVIVLDEGVDIQTDDIQHFLYGGRMERVYFGEHITAIGKLRLFFYAPYAEVHFDKALESIEYLHVSLNYETIVATSPQNRMDLYFGGDCPAMDEGALYNNGFAGMQIHYHEGAKGFTTFMQSASTVCIEDEVIIPPMSISEYVLASNRAARDLAKAIYDKSVAVGNDEFLLFPISGLEFYFELKEFVLDLTKDCTSTYDKAEIIFDWIVENIEYDDEYMTAAVEEVFYDRKAVCAGYCFLYHDMLSAAGIPSFYTRGAPLYGLPSENTESFVRASLDSSQQSVTHGWVYAIIDGKAVCCDPTWGDFDMTDEYLSMTRLIFQVDGVNVVFDKKLYRLLDSGMVYCDGEFYLVSGGAASGGGQLFMTINFVLNLSFFVNRNSKVTHGSESFDSPLVIPYGAVYHDGLFYYDDPKLLMEAGIQSWRYCMSDGKAIDFILLLRYMSEETNRYGTTFKTRFDLGFCSFDDKMAYYEYKPGELMVLVSFASVSSLSVPAEVNGKKVTSLGASCFHGMDGLEEVILPDGLEEMVNSCFDGCTSLVSINIPSSVKTIGGSVFWGCSSLKSIELPEGIDTIANAVFIRCRSLEQVNIPSSVVTIESLAFSGCYSLSKITLPEGLKKIEEYAFSYCSSLEEIFIPAAVETIEPAAFGYCPKLSSIAVDPDNPYFDSRDNCNAIMRTETDTLVCACKSTVFPSVVLAFESFSCAGVLGFEEIAIPSSVVEIGMYAFVSCENLRDIDFGETGNLRVLSLEAFSFCRALREVVLPEGLETIAEAVFADCPALVALTLPSTVRSIGANIAYGARNLFEATYRGSVENWEAVEKDPEWFNGTSCHVVHCQNGDVQIS